MGWAIWRLMLYAGETINRSFKLVMVKFLTTLAGNDYTSPRWPID